MVKTRLGDTHQQEQALRPSKALHSRLLSSKMILPCLQLLLEAGKL